MASKVDNEHENELGSAGNAGGDDQPEKSLAHMDQSRLPKILKFNELARCGDEIWIENNGQIYRLRRTKQGKLILTK